MKKSNQSFLQKCNEEYLAQLHRCNNPRDTVEGVFHDIMDQLEDTVFYNDHALQDVHDIDGFKKKIPIRAYYEFDGYIDLLLRGAQNVLSKSKCFAFYKTSGTSGKSKYIPSTYHWRQEYRGPALYAQWGLYFKLINAVSLEAGNVLDMSWSRKKSWSVNSLPAYSITSRPSALDGNDWNPPWHDSDWFMSEEGEDHTEVTLNQLVATATNDVKIIVSVNPSKIVFLYDTINSNMERFVSRLRNRRDAEKDSKLSYKLDVLVNRLSGKDSINLLDLWPELKLLVCWRSASAGKYIQWLNKAAPEIPVVPFSTVGTEGIVTIPVDSSSTGGALSINQGLYEFVDVNSLENPSEPLRGDQHTLNFDEVIVGKNYRLVMSQANGIYRYDTNDVYKVVGWVGKTPRIEFVGRSNVGSSFTGEKLSEDNIYDTVKKALNGLCESLPFFTCVPVWDTPPRYVMLIEATDNGLLEKYDELEKRLNQILCEENEEYAEKCRTNRLQRLSLVLLKPGAFSNINKINIANGVSSAQVKHLWIQSNDKLLDMMVDNGLSITPQLEVA